MFSILGKPSADRASFLSGSLEVATVSIFVKMSEYDVEMGAVGALEFLRELLGRAIVFGGMFSIFVRMCE